jgi:predicted phosphate transport protein (TIGR00153 family)
MFGSKKKDAAFFDAFSRHAAKSVEASHMLVEMMELLQVGNGGAAKNVYRLSNAPSAGPELEEPAKQLYVKIKRAETEADSITHDTIKRLHENWITPFDRDDIHSLISRMDDVLDLIEAAAERIVLFQVAVAPPEAMELSKLLVLSCEALGRAIALLSTMARAPEILELCVEVNRLENAADSVHRRAMADLFKAGNDPLMVMKWRDILDGLESATDRCEDVANILEGVVLEYA